MNDLEMDILRKIRLALSKEGVCTFRINTGKFKMQDGRWFDVGVPKGFSDLIAIKNGKIYFIEVKTQIGLPSKEQLSFLETMKNIYGCGGGIARCPKDALKIISQ